MLLRVSGQGPEALVGKLADLALGLTAATEVPTFHCPLHPHIDGKRFAFPVGKQQDTIGYFLSDSRQCEENSAGRKVLRTLNGVQIDFSGGNAPGDITHVRSTIA
jgi:hypothetical protein